MSFAVRPCCPGPSPGEWRIGGQATPVLADDIPATLSSTAPHICPAFFAPSRSSWSPRAWFSTTLNRHGIRAASFMQPEWLDRTSLALPRTSECQSFRRRQALSSFRGASVLTCFVEASPSGKQDLRCYRPSFRRSHEQLRHLRSHGGFDRAKPRSAPTCLSP